MKDTNRTRVTVYVDPSCASGYALVQRFARSGMSARCSLGRRRWSSPRLREGSPRRVARSRLLSASVAPRDARLFFRLWRTHAFCRMPEMDLVVFAHQSIGAARVCLSSDLLLDIGDSVEEMVVQFYFRSCEPQLHNVTLVQDATGERWTHSLDEHGALAPCAVAPLAACQPCTLIVGSRYQTGNAVILPSSTLKALAAKRVSLCVRPDPGVVQESKIIADAQLQDLED